MIKYLGSKRALIPQLTLIAQAAQAQTALDMFSGTTRVAQAFKAQGIATAANDIATYSKALSECYIATDAREINLADLQAVITDLNESPGKSGYFTETFCERSRFFQPKNGRRIEAIRHRIEQEFRLDPFYPILLTSLLEAADRVDSTTGVQMAYLKNWAPRSWQDLQLRVPALLEGRGWSLQLDANDLAGQLRQRVLGETSPYIAKLPCFEMVYLDPPYNQHRYFTNYHIWETLIRWDQPETYGVACKRVDAREEWSHSAYNRRRQMPETLADLIRVIPCETLVLSYNNESWISFEQLFSLISERFEDCEAFSFDYKRYVGAQIGIHNHQGKRVGKVSHLRNLEYIFVGGSSPTIARIRAALAAN